MKLVFAAFSLTPLAYLCYMVFTLSVNIPSFDEWYYIPMFEKVFLGTFTFKDLWVTVNEHRLLIPKLILILSVKFTHWNLHYLIALNVVAGVGIYFVITKFLVRESKVFPSLYFFHALIMTSLLLFSLVQYENWLWGIQILIFINQLATLIGFYILTSYKISQKYLIFAFIAGFFATFTHLAGLLFWPICLLIIVFNRSTQKNKMVRLAFFWFVASISVYAFYFRDYFDAIQTAPDFATISLQRGLNVLLFTSAVLGSPLELLDKKVSTIIGFLGMLIFVLYAFLSTKVHKFTNFHLFLVALALYGYFSSAMTAFGRTGYEPPYVASRYSSFPILFWLSLVFFILFLVSWTKKKLLLVKMFGVVFLGVVVLLSINGSIQGTNNARVRAEILRTALKGYLISSYPENVLQITTVYPRMDIGNGQYIVHLPHVLQKIEILSKYRLSFFYDSLK